jgi:tetratricopeptide (TPR) repeat protein
MYKQGYHIIIPKRKHLLLLLGVVCMYSSWGAETNKNLFDAANKTYKAGHYTEAIEQYTLLVSKGAQSTELYYNLGNAYYKDHQIGLAILSYEKAIKLSPDDEDTRQNLRLANSKITDRITPVQELSIVTSWRHFKNKHSSTTWAIWSIVLVWAALLCMAFYLFAASLRRAGFYTGVLFLAISCWLVYMGYMRYQVETHPDMAILTTSNTYVKSAPNTTGTDLFIIHEGIKLNILDQVGEWVKVRLLDGKVGWIPRNTFAMI